MKIAITADLHLPSQPHEHPERYNALGDILRQCTNLAIDTLVIAGDLFDKDNNNPSAFEQLVRETAHSELKILLLPGNHDSRLNPAAFSSPVISVITTAQWVHLGEKETPFLLLPYQHGTTMGDAISKAMDPTRSHFVLISHGSWIGGNTAPNPFEPGTYMPLLSADLRKHHPRRVFLGHIHVPSAEGSVMYTGSPCPLDITETGRRSFLIFDVETDTVSRQPIKTDQLNYIIEVSVVPSSNELTNVLEKVMKVISAEQVAENEFSKVNLRVKLSGTSRHKAQLVASVKTGLGKNGLRNIEIQDSNLMNNDDPTLERLAEKTREAVAKQEITDADLYPSKEDVVAYAMNILYGEG